MSDACILMEFPPPFLGKVDELMKTESQIISFGIDMCNALIEYEKKKIIKPENNVVSQDGISKLGDPGVALSLEHATFMAPEVANGEEGNQQANIYALGIVLYCLLNERRMPFLPLPPQEILLFDCEKALERRYSGEALPPPVNGSKKLKEVALKACAFEPKNRYQTIQEMREELLLLSEKSGVVPRSVPISSPGEEGESKIDLVFKPIPEKQGADDQGKTATPDFDKEKHSPVIKPREQKRWKNALLIAVALIVCIAVLAGNIEEHICRIITGNVMMAGNNYFNCREVVKKINAFWVSTIGATRDSQGFIWMVDGTRINPWCEYSSINNACMLILPTATMLCVIFSLCIMLIVHLIQKEKLDSGRQENANRTRNCVIVLFLIYFAAFVLFEYWAPAYMLWILG